jgi:choice-of-anchor A domain-containing protein
LALLGAGALRAENLMSALVDVDSNVSNYNLVTLGDATFTNFGDTEAGLAVGGNLTLSGGAIAAQPGNFGLNGNPTLYAAGSLSLSGTTQLESGYASLPGAGSSHFTWDASTHDLSAKNGSGDLNTTNAGGGTYANSSPLTNPGPAGWNWSTVGTNLKADSTTLANATVNGTIGVSSNNLTFTPNQTPGAGAIVVFNLNANLLSGNSYNGQSFSNVSINVPTDVNYVINVTNAAGSTVFGCGVNFNAGSNDNSLLWNIEGSGDVALGGGQFYGAVLAPNANVSNANGTVFVGQVAAQSFTDTDAEMHFEDFVVVPEPVTFALWAVGLCGLAILGRRRLTA